LPLALGLAACAAQVTSEDQISDQQAAKEVGTVRQALGGWSERWHATQPSTLAGVGSSLTAVARMVNDCGDLGRQIDLIDHATGLPLVTHSEATGETFTVSPLPSCSNITAIYTSPSSSGGNDTVYVADSLHKKILLLQSVSLSWREVASTPGTGITKLLVANSTLYWQDSAGIHLQGVIGGAFFATLTTDPNALLLGLESSDAYIQFKVGDQFALRKIRGPNSSVTTLRTQSAPFGSLTFDRDNFYWTETGATRRLRQMTKSGASVSTVHDSTTVIYGNPRSDGSMLYWTEFTPATSTHKFRRKNLTNGNHVSVAMPWPAFFNVTLSSTGVYVFAYDPSLPTPFLGLFRGSL
jgi:hypothetical protein